MKMDFVCGLNAESQFLDRTGKIAGVAKSIKIRTPSNKIRPCMWTSEDDSPMMESPNYPSHEEDDYVSVTDFDKFILPQIDNWVKDKQKELEEKHELMKTDIHEFLSNRRTQRLVDEMITNMKYTGEWKPYR